MSYDKKRLAELVVKAKGDDRSLRQYAEAANVSPSIISRILSGTYKPGIKVLQKLTSEAANPQGGVELKDLTVAAGYSADVALATGVAAASGTIATALLTATNPAGALLLPLVGPLGVPLGAAAGVTINKLFLEVKKKTAEKGFEKQNEEDETLKSFEKKFRHFKTLAMGIIRDSMTEKDVEWLPGKLENIDETFKPDDFVIIKNSTIQEWWFSFWNQENEVENFKFLSLSDQLLMLLSRYILVEPKENRKITIVINDKKLYEYVSSIGKKISLNGNYSIILVDIENLNILGEYDISVFGNNEQLLSLT